MADETAESNAIAQISSYKKKWNFVGIVDVVRSFESNVKIPIEGCKALRQIIYGNTAFSVKLSKLHLQRVGQELASLVQYPL
jgi:hypothetical protein